MVARPSVLLVVALAVGSLGASYRTQNFVVEAQTPAIAQQVGQYAEHYRKTKAREWLGQEMPPWPQPCPLRVTVTMGGSGGATSFAFDRGRILSQEMQVEGTLERVLASVLPHEITHTVFAHYFRCPVPRWADEGGSVLSEDDIERNRHDQLVRQILNTPGRMIPLRRLFALTQYPRDVMVLYAEGFSVTNFLVSRSNRQAFLTFVAHGMRGNWDTAIQAHYGFRNVEELEQAWLQHLRDTRRPPGTLASAAGRGMPARTSAQPLANPSARVLVRQTVPPAQPVLGAPQPIVRGVSGSDLDTPARPAPVPAFPPRTNPLPRSTAPSAAPPAPPVFPVPPPPPAGLGRPTPAFGSPVGYSP